MIPTPASILQRITEGSLLPPDVISTLDHGSLLDARDGDEEFVADWMRLYNEIEAQWAIADIADEIAQLAEDIRRESFLTVSRATGQHEIASYVSDDFDIIVRGSVLGLDDEFLNGLWDAYDRDEIPDPPIGK